MGFDESEFYVRPLCDENERAHIARTCQASLGARTICICKATEFLLRQTLDQYNRYRCHNEEEVTQYVFHMTQQQKVFANADVDKEVERIHGLLGNPLPFSIPKFQRCVFDAVADFGSPIHYKGLEILDEICTHFHLFFQSILNH